MTDKSFKQWLRKTKPITNAEFQKWKAEINEGISAAVDAMQKQITAGMLELMTGHSDKPVGRS